MYGEKFQVIVIIIIIKRYFSVATATFSSVHRLPIMIVLGSLLERTPPIYNDCSGQLARAYTAYLQ